MLKNGLSPAEGSETESHWDLFSEDGSQVMKKASLEFFPIENWEKTFVRRNHRDRELWGYRYSLYSFFRMLSS